MREIDRVGRSYVKRIVDHDALGMAAELAYRFMFALFPFVIFVAALGSFVASWLGIVDPTSRILDAVGRELPPDLVEPLRRQLEVVLSHTQPELLSIGAVITLYASTGGMNAVMKAMDRAFGVRETRPLLRRWATSALLTLVVGLGILFSFVAVVGGTLMTQRVVDDLGWGGIWPSLALARWPAAVMLLVCAVTALLRFSPSCRPSWRAAFTGSAAFSVAWLVVTYAFGVYVSRFAAFDATYGALAGVIVLMLWFYLTGFLLVCAGELAAFVAERGWRSEP